VQLAEKGERRVGQHCRVQRGGGVAGAVQLLGWELGGPGDPVGCASQGHEQAGVVQEGPAGGAVGGDGEPSQHAVAPGECLGEISPPGRVWATQASGTVEIPQVAMIRS
jgi:hypothetical protein